MVKMVAQVATQNEGVEILSGSLQRTGEGHLERRRPKRQERVSPQLLSLLRDADRLATHSEAEERLSPALALVVIVSCSATLWSGIIRAATWLAG